MAPTLSPFDLLLDQVRLVVREEIGRALNGGAPARDAEPPLEWMRAEDLAKKYKLPKSLFEELGREGKIERSRPGRHILFNAASVERFIRSRAAGGAAANGDH